MYSIGIIVSILFTFYGLLTRFQGWDDSLSNTVEMVCIYGGIVGVIVYSVLAYIEYRFENKKIEGKKFKSNEEFFDYFTNKQEKK